MPYRKATGRPMRVPWSARSTRDIMRRHLRDHGKTIAELAPVWDMHPTSVYRRFYDNRRPLTPNYVSTFCDWLKLDDLDRNTLHLSAAREAGWELELSYLKLL